MSTAMFIKSAIAMLLTIGFAGGAVYYGTNGQSAKNEVDLQVPENTGAIHEVAKPATNNSEDSDTASLQEPALKEQTLQEPKVQEPEDHQNRFDMAQVMPLLMKQTDKIKAVEIKDQAYLDIVNFSVSQRQFKFADAAMQEIDKTELRDTARSQIAIGLALEGRADEAFEVIDTVEIGTLRDVMRLQVIEALILPSKLPPGLVRQ